MKKYIVLLLFVFCIPVFAEDVKLPEKSKFKLVLLIGQSNMAGRGFVEEADKVPHPRVVMLDTQSRCYGANQYMSNWLRLTGDRKKALKTFLHRFRELGCSRPAIVSPYLRTKNVPINDVHTVYSLGEVAEGLIRIKLREECPSNSLLARSILRKTLHRYYRKYNFDALILDIANVSFGENVHEFCNLPQSVKICGIHNSAENLGVPYCIADAPYEQMGYDAVKVLLESTRSRGEILYDYTFKNFDLLN